MLFIISVKLASFVNILPSMQPSFLFTLSLHQSLTTVIALLYGLPKHVTKQLQRVQNAAARIVSLSPKFCHITPVLMSLHWLPIDLRIEFKILIITYKTLHGLALAYIEDLLVSYIPGRYLRFTRRAWFQTKQLWFCCCAVALEQSSTTC